MAGDRCAPGQPQEAAKWAQEQFAHADLADQRLNRRLIKLAATMAANPEASIPQQCGVWGDTLAAYRLLHNDRVTLQKIIQPHVHLTRQQCSGEPVVLNVQDVSVLEPVHELTQTRLLQHLAVAVNADGHLLGLLHGQWREEPCAAGQTREQRRARWRRSRLWPQAVQAIGRPPEGCRMIMVADREADDFQAFTACRDTGQGFVIRSQHNRYINGGQDRLHGLMGQQPAGGGRLVNLPRQGKVDTGPPEGWRKARAPRRAKVLISWCRVSLDPPVKDDRFHEPQAVWAVRVWEIDPPLGVDQADRLDWLLLSSEPVVCLDQAVEVIDYYQHRWVIEELHKAQKTGCRLEASQLQDAAAFCRLSAICAVIAVRLVALRDVAEQGIRHGEQAAAAVLSEQTDSLWRVVVSQLAGVSAPDDLTVGQFYRTVASQGGWLGRKGDGRPGWRALWRGWQRVGLLVHGARLALIHIARE